MSKKTKEKAQQIKINNHGFFQIIIVLLCIFVVFIFLQIFTCKICFCGLKDSLGIASQIITAISVCVLQILGISFSIQNNEWCGIKLQYLIKIRVDKHFNFLWIALISISFLVLSIITYSINLFYINFVSMVLSIVFSIYVLICEIPYLMMDDKTLKQVIKNNLIYYYNQNNTNETLLEKDFNEMIQKLICQKDLKISYDMYSIKNEKEYNKFLLYKLLANQQTTAFNLDGIDDKRTLKQITDVLLQSVKDAMCSNFDITQILGDDFKNYSYFLTRVLFRLMETDFNKKVINSIASCIRWKNFDRKTNQAQHDLYVNCIIALVTITVKNNDFRLIEAIKKEYSLNYFLLDDKFTSTLLFAIISMFLYYLAEKEKDITDEVKNKIKDFIMDERIEDNTQILSWKSLFKQFAGSFNIEYLEFIEAYRQNEHNIEQMYNSSFAHWVVLDETFVNKWYLANLFNKNLCFNDDYSVILKDLTNGKNSYFLENFVKENFIDKDFQPTPDLINIVKFYSDEKDLFTGFQLNERNNNSFIKYYEALKIEELITNAKKLANVSNEELVDKYKPLLEKEFLKEWNILSLKDKENCSKKYISFIFDRISDAINFDEALVNCLTQSVLRDIGKSVKYVAIRSSDLNNQIGCLIENEFEGISQSAEYYSWHILDKDNQDKYIKQIRNTEKIKGQVLTGTYFIKKDAYSLEFGIDEFSVKDLNEDQLNHQIDEYKRADGQYVYEGIFMQREEVDRLIKNKYVIYTLVYSYKLNIKQEGIFRMVGDD